MRKKAKMLAERLAQELKSSYPGVLVDIRDPSTTVAEAWIQVTCGSHDQVDDVTEDLGHLTTKYYLDEGVYFQVSVTYSGPIPHPVKEQ